VLPDCTVLYLMWRPRPEWDCGTTPGNFRESLAQ
jgi:hypothetical protein